MRVKVCVPGLDLPAARWKEAEKVTISESEKGNNGVECVRK
jgi:hypothetical protein